MGWNSPGIFNMGGFSCRLQALQPCGSFPAPNIPRPAGVRPRNWLMSCESCFSSETVYFLCHWNPNLNQTLDWTKQIKEKWTEIFRLDFFRKNNTPTTSTHSQNLTTAWGISQNSTSMIRNCFYSLKDSVSGQGRRIVLVFSASMDPFTETARNIWSTK